jgi:hypothetical protein
MSNRNITLTIQFQSVGEDSPRRVNYPRTAACPPVFWIEADQRWQTTLVGTLSEIAHDLQRITESGMVPDAIGTLYVERFDNDLLNFPLSRNGESYTFLFPLCAGMEGIRAILDHIDRFTAN